MGLGELQVTDAVDQSTQVEHAASQGAEQDPGGQQQSCSCTSLPLAASPVQYGQQCVEQHAWIAASQITQPEPQNTGFDLLFIISIYLFLFIIILKFLLRVCFIVCLKGRVVKTEKLRKRDQEVSHPLVHSHRSHQPELSPCEARSQELPPGVGFPCGCRRSRT